MASSSSSVPTRGWTHEVFLSFRGEDTRNNFVDHLYAALVRKGIQTFKDNKVLCVGKTISHELRKAIKESRSTVVVFSENYANSSWCLEELAKIMKCWGKGQKVIPVFYHVDPSDVRKQTGSFATDFQKHEDKFKGEMDKVSKWREALTAAANLSGYHISADRGGESAYIDKIVQEILGNIPARGRNGNLIGLESHMDALHSLLNLEATEEVRVVGIFGMGGIGKTTIAQALFKRIAYKFEGSSFVKDVRENSSTPKDICTLQENILKDILMANHEFKIQDPENGADMIQDRLRNKKVLLVLDDVDDSKQLEFLAESHDWFGPGSRIIIATRNKQLLSDANHKYKPDLLRMDQAVELFSRHAFRKISPPDGYKELSDRAIDYTGRLPLALKVLGSFFKGIEACLWENALARLSEIPDSEIHRTLKLSFDSLHVLEQKIFLDIACFYKGHDEESVTRILDSFNFYPRIGINSLINKSLITISNNKIHMHDLIQEMGWHTVRQSFSNGRLWQFSVIRDFLNKQRELDAIEAIVVPVGIQVDERERLSANVFKRMNNIRLLDIDSYFTFDIPTFLPDTLRWFCWHDYPFSSVPIANMSKLVGLEMQFSKLEQLWEGHKNMMNLRFINLKRSYCLKRFPDVSGAPNVERLDLLECVNLVEVHESLGCLKRLIYLNMTNCSNLKCLPSRLEMESLETLILYGCWSLKRFPELSPCMVKLSHIDLSYCQLLEELPSSFKYLSNLSFLMLTDCINLKIIPNFICELKCLKSLGLHHSNHFHALTNLCSLRKLDLSCSWIRENDFPKNLHGLSSLEELDLSFNHQLLELPASISHLSSLKQLNLNYCSKLQYLNRLPSGIQVLTARNCKSLRKIENLSEDYEWLYNINLSNCPKLREDEENERYLDMMIKQSFVKKYAALHASLSICVPGRKIPSWFEEQQQNGKKISLKLPPKWQTQIMGFAISAVFEPETLYFNHNMDLIFENEGMGVSEPQINVINASDDDDRIEKGDLWIGYIPFSLLKQMNDDEGWSHIFEGNLVINIPDKDAVRFGAKVVYKEEELKSTQQIISYYYWIFKINQTSQNTFTCKF